MSHAGLRDPYVTIWHDGYTGRHILTAGTRLAGLHYRFNDELPGRSCVCWLFGDVRQTEVRLIVFFCELGNWFLVEVHSLYFSYFVPFNRFLDVGYMRLTITSQRRLSVFAPTLSPS